MNIEKKWQRVNKGEGYSSNKTHDCSSSDLDGVASMVGDGERQKDKDKDKTKLPIHYELKKLDFICR